MTATARATTTRRRPPRPRLVPTCEGLETRRLLSGDMTPTFAYTLSGDADRLDPAPQFTTTATGRTDLHTLAPTGNWPSATIALLWAFGPTITTARIVVSDASSLVRLDAPLEGPAAFTATVGIPTKAGQQPETVLLNVKVAFLESPIPGNNLRSYRLDANFPPLPIQLPQNLAPPGSTPDPGPPNLTTSSLPDDQKYGRTFSVTAYLPIFPDIDNGPSTPGGPTEIPVGPAPVLPPPGPPASPVSPSPPVGSGIPAPSVVGLLPSWTGRAVTIPLSDQAPGWLATVVGPLPMGPSVEAGGVLAQDRGPSMGLIVIDNPEVRAAGATKPEQLPAEQDPESRSRTAPPSWMMASTGRLPAESSSALPFAVELAATGVAFLPPIPPAPLVDGVGRQTVAAPRQPEPEPEPEPGHEPRRSRLPALVAAALVGSTTLVVHLTRKDQGTAVGWRRARSAIAASVGRSPRSRTARPAR